MVVPRALAYNAPAASQAVSALMTVLGGPSDPATALWQLAGELGAPRSLTELGMVKAEFARIAHQVVSAPYANPREATEDAVRGLLQPAWAGDRLRS